MICKLFCRNSYFSKVLNEISTLDKNHMDLGWKESNFKLLQFMRSQSLNQSPDDGIKIAVPKLTV